MDELKTLNSSEKADVIAITEVLPKNSLFPVQEYEVSMAGYEMVSKIEKPSTNHKRGIILYAKEKYNVRERDLHNSFQEAILIDLLLPTDKTVHL